MYQVILRSRGIEITIDSEDDLDLSLDLLDDLTSVLNLNKHSVRVTPIKTEPIVEDYRAVRETQSRDTGQADILEKALRQIGRPANSAQLTDIAVRKLGFETTSKNPQAIIRQVLRKYPRFTQVDRNYWTLTEGFRKPDEQLTIESLDEPVTAPAEVKRRFKVKRIGKIGSDTIEDGSTESLDPISLMVKRDGIIAALGYRDEVNLIKRSRALFWDTTHTYRAICTVSKRYPRKGYEYWYAFHPSWDTFLGEGEVGNLVLGCADLSVAFVLPLSFLHSHLHDFNVSVKPDGSKYWHLHIFETADNEYAMRLHKSGGHVSLTQFILPLT